MSSIPWKEALAALDSGERLSVVCPDGNTRTVYAYNPHTGDLLVAGWPGDVWMDCRDGTLRAEFEPHKEAGDN